MYANCIPCKANAGKQLTPRERQIEVLKYLEKNSGITAREFAKARPYVFANEYWDGKYTISTEDQKIVNRAQASMKRMAKSGIIQQVTVGKKHTYYHPDIPTPAV